MKKKSKISLKRNEYSNFITPPDFVSDKLHTITIINATTDDIELVVNLCQFGNESYNIYLYSMNMDQIEWLTQAIQKSDAIVVNADVNEDYCQLEKTYYYGKKTFLTPAVKVNGILDYFVQRQKGNK